MSKKREINNNTNCPDKDTIKPVTDSTSVVAFTSTRSIGTQTSADVNTAKDCGTQTSLESLRGHKIYQDHLRRLLVVVVAILVVAVGVILGKGSTSANPQIVM
jgi:hypothetical protein